MKVAIIGAGPAGLMASIAASQNGAEVFLFDKNEKVCKKLYITGKGRCNVTNTAKLDDFLKNVVSNSKFMFGALKSFSSEDTISFFEGNGTALKVERGGRVFPESDKASDISDTLKRVAKNQNVNIKLNSYISEISQTDDGFDIVMNNKKETFDRVVLATGGKSYVATGSDGFGYILAKKLGHNIVEPRGALCAIKLKDKFVKDLMGLSLKNVELSAKLGDKIIHKEFGEMLFTDCGISGPIVLSLSSYLNRLDTSFVDIAIDLKPALDEQTLDIRLLREIEENKNKGFGYLCHGLLPKSLANIFPEIVGISAFKQLNSITKEERKTIIEGLKHFKLSYDSLYDINSAIITSGGVDVKEINPKTMQSKIVDGLFFAGEIIDVDALTGGYNIQIALSTGYVAGINSAY